MVLRFLPKTDDTATQNGDTRQKKFARHIDTASGWGIIQLASFDVSPL